MWRVSGLAGIEFTFGTRLCATGWTITGQYPLCVAFLEIAGPIQNPGDVIGADDVRESDWLFRVRDLVVKPALFQRFDI